MCIIGVKDFGAPLIEKETLKHCWNNNGDGAGFAFLDTNDEWNVEKGFMSFDSFWRAFSSKKFTETNMYIVHFRFGTSGSKDGGNTHPFPIFSDKDGMREVSFISKHIAFHNGSCGFGSGIYSDSVLATDTYIKPFWTVLVDHPKYNDVLEPLMEEAMELDRSRWILTNGPEISFYGDGWIDDKGITWSNNMYKDNVFRKVTYNKHKTNTGAHGGAHGAGNYTSFIDGVKRQYVNGVYKIWDTIVGDWVVDYEYNRTMGIKVTTPSELVVQKHHKGKVNKNGKIIPLDSSITVSADLISTALLDNTGKIVWEDPRDDLFVSMQCPHCFDNDNLSESPFKGREFLCTNCGACFDKDTGVIRMMDPQYNKNDVTKGVK